MHERTMQPPRPSTTALTPAPTTAPERPTADDASTPAAWSTSDLLASILDGVADGIAAYDASGELIFLNDAGARTCGYSSAAEAIAAPTGDFLSRVAVFDEAGSALCFGELPGQLAAHGKIVPERLLRMRIRATGGERWVSVKATPILDRRGAVRMSISIFRDVTRERRVEAERDRQELRRARHEADAAIARLEDVLESMAEAFHTCDHEGRLLHINRAGRQQLRRIGVDAEALLGQVPWDALPALRGTTFQTELERVQQQRVPTRFEIQAPFSRQWFEIHAYPTADGIAGYVRDISARKRTEIASQFLADASAILASTLDLDTTLESIVRLAIQHLADGCAIRLLDERGTVQRTVLHSRDASKAALLREMERRYPSRIGSVGGVERAIRAARSTLVRRVTDRALIEVAMDANHLDMLRGLDLHSLMYVPFVARGRVVGVITLASHTASRRFDDADLALAEDLAHRAALAVDNARLYDAEYRERRVAEEALCRAEEARLIADRANEAKIAFLAAMSHELRTPLNVIAGYTELLEMGVHGPTTPAQRDALGRIQRSQRQLHSIIRELTPARP